MCMQKPSDEKLKFAEMAFIYLFIYLLGANQKEHRLTDVVKRDGDQGNE